VPGTAIERATVLGLGRGGLAARSDPAEVGNPMLLGTLLDTAQPWWSRNECRAGGVELTVIDYGRVWVFWRRRS
jgi:hypothetical protein